MIQQTMSHYQLGPCNKSLNKLDLVKIFLHNILAIRSHSEWHWESGWRAQFLQHSKSLYLTILYQFLFSWWQNGEHSRNSNIFVGIVNIKKYFYLFHFIACFYIILSPHSIMLSIIACFDQNLPETK